ncbi:MAG: hypothetical protein R3288_09110 [Woeseiaceae bacterium]|nr:hypothetical protein [Woeseiaceae bacterium]
MRMTATLLLTMIAAMPATGAAAETLVKEFRGDSTVTTSDFVVEGPWLLDWRLDGDYENLIALDITLIESRTGRHVGRVKHVKAKGTGLRLFEEGGVYKLRVSSTLARWRIKILQIPPEEAELYTPKNVVESPFRINQ